MVAIPGPVIVHRTRGLRNAEWCILAAKQVSDVTTLWVGLDCALDVLNRREHGRPGRWGGLAEASLNVHDGWTYDLRLDTTDDPEPDLLAAQIHGLLQEPWGDTGPDRHPDGGSRTAI